MLKSFLLKVAMRFMPPARPMLVIKVMTAKNSDRFFEVVDNSMSGSEMMSCACEKYVES